DGIRDLTVTGVQTCALPISRSLEMGKKLYVGNLGYGVTDSDLQRLFEAHGTVESAQVIIDRDTGRSKGFGFVEMKTEQEAQAAIDRKSTRLNSSHSQISYAV